MAARARHLPPPLPHHAYDVDDAFDLEPGERIGKPLRRRNKALRRALFLLVVCGGAWATFADRSSWPDWRPALSSLHAWAKGLLPASADPSVLTASAPRQKSEPPPRPLATPETTMVAPAPIITGSVLPTAAAKPETESADDKEAEAQPLPPPKADPADPLQMRAVAIGLHPEISRAVLARLTQADFQNCEHAIRTALAEAKDSTVFVWPRQRKPELALFHVRFVRGGAPGCRRYVVTVTKDGWLTTALPMERCGPQPSLPREAAARR